jgi:hypothetical protein
MHFEQFKLAGPITSSFPRDRYFVTIIDEMMVQGSVWYRAVPPVNARLAGLPGVLYFVPFMSGFTHFTGFAGLLLPPAVLFLAIPRFSSFLVSFPELKLVNAVRQAA